MTAGTKRPLSQLVPPISPPPPHNHSTTPPNNPHHLVYVRRKTDIQTCTNGVVDTSNDNDNNNKNNADISKEAIQPTPQMDESKLLQTDIPAAREQHINKATEMASKQRELRHRELQLVLSDLDPSQQQDNLQGLRSLSSVELSRYAVELEKRSIQLSLEEAKELLRVGELNVLGKSTMSLKPSLAQADLSEK